MRSKKVVIFGGTGFGVIARNGSPLVIRNCTIAGNAEGGIRTINNDLVLVFLQIESDHEEPFNYLLKYFKIPFDVNSEQIWADYEDNHLYIVMPFKELTDGYFRTVEINS